MVKGKGPLGQMIWDPRSQIRVKSLSESDRLCLTVGWSGTRRRLTATLAIPERPKGDRSTRSVVAVIDARSSRPRLWCIDESPMLMLLVTLATITRPFDVVYLHWTFSRAPFSLRTTMRSKGRSCPKGMAMPWPWRCKVGQDHRLPDLPFGVGLPHRHPRCRRYRDRGTEVRSLSRDRRRDWPAPALAAGWPGCRPRHRGSSPPRPRPCAGSHR